MKDVELFGVKDDVFMFYLFMAYEKSQYAMRQSYKV